MAPGLPEKTRKKTEKKREEKTGKKNTEKKTGKNEKKKPWKNGENNTSKIGWRTLLRGGGVTNISRDWAYLIAGGSLIAPGHYTRKNYYNIFLGCFF